MSRQQISTNTHRAAHSSCPAGKGRAASQVSVLLITALVALGGCGAPAPESRLAKASGALEDKSGDLETVNAYIQETQATLAELKEQRRQLRNKVRSLEERVAARATDVALFRTIQSALLDEPLLREAALAAEVEDARVTLSGSVTKSEHKARALALAEGVAGVAAVKSQIRVDDSAAGGGDDG